MLAILFLFFLWMHNMYVFLPVIMFNHTRNIKFNLIKLRAKVSCSILLFLDDFIFFDPHERHFRHFWVESSQQSTFTAFFCWLLKWKFAYVSPFFIWYFLKSAAGAFCKWKRKNRDERNTIANQRMYAPHCSLFIYFYFFVSFTT